MEYSQTNTPLKKIKKPNTKMSRYFDLDGLCFIASIQTLSKYLDVFRFLSLSVKWEIFSDKKCLNKNFINFHIEGRKKFKLFEYFQFYIGSQESILGKFDFFILIKKSKNQNNFEDLIWNSLIESCSKTPFHSYYNTKHKFKFINFTMDKLFNCLEKLEMINDHKVFLYGENTV